MSESVSWPHAPPHFTQECGIYMVTASTYGKEKLFRDRASLKFLHDLLLELADHYGWTLQAWAVLANHYHFVALSPEGGAGNLKKFLRHLHANSARFVNKRDDVAGRKVWHNFWESQITYDASHYARLKYVNENAVHHGLVTSATDYPWCSARWFERVASASFFNTVNSFRTDTLNVRDAF